MGFADGIAWPEAEVEEEIEGGNKKDEEYSVRELLFD